MASLMLPGSPLGPQNRMAFGQRGGGLGQLAAQAVQGLRQRGQSTTRNLGGFAQWLQELLSSGIGQKATLGSSGGLSGGLAFGSRDGVSNTPLSMPPLTPPRPIVMPQPGSGRAPWGSGSALGPLDFGSPNPPRFIGPAALERVPGVVPQPGNAPFGQDMPTVFDTPLDAPIIPDRRSVPGKRVPSAPRPAGPAFIQNRGLSRALGG